MRCEEIERATSNEERNLANMIDASLRSEAELSIPLI